ncbi:MAG: hypothetical protein ACK5LK_02370 [Chthoniobacterales bacterium]
MKKIILTTIISCTSTVFTLSTCLAQDVVVLNNGTPRSGEIIGFGDGKVRLQIGQGGQKATTSIAMDQVKSITKSAPASFEKALEAWKKNDAKTTIADLTPLFEKFNGLPTTWAERIGPLLADANIEVGNTDAAAAALQKFEAAYPDASNVSNLTKAKIAVSKKDYGAAKTLLAPIVAQGSETKLADTAQSIAFGQAFYLMAQIREQEGAYPEAVQDYLRTATIFFADPATTDKARARADELIAEKNVVVP